MWIQRTPAGIGALAFAPDGRHLYAGDRTEYVTEWDTAARAPRRWFNVWSNIPFGMFCAAGGRFLVIPGNRPAIWDLAAGVAHGHLDTVELGFGYIGSPGSLTADPTDAGRLLFVFGDSTRICTWNLPAGIVGPDFGSWPEHGLIAWFAVSPDGRLVALVPGGMEGKVILIERATGAARTFRPQSFIDVVKFSPDGGTLAASGPWGAWLWEFESGRSTQVEGMQSRHANPSRPFCFHPTAPLVATLNEAGEPTLFDRATGRAIRSFDFALGKRVLSMCFSPDGLTCAVGGSNKQFAVFDVDP